MFNRLISSFMLLLMLFYVACASTLQHSTLPASSPADASVLTSVDVALQGLPDAYQAPLNSQDASIPFTPSLEVSLC
jgi:methionine-rich copper-binding protein CopC